MKLFSKYIFFLALALFLIFSSNAYAQNETELAKKTQNPISDLISLPFQSNFNFGAGPGNDLQYTLNVQPIYPSNINQEWNWIHRTIVPIMYQPELAPGVGDEFGLGDIQYQGYLSPKNSDGLIWGVGPVLNFATATDDSLGTEKWSAGPGAVLVNKKGQWVIGILFNNIWSFAGTNNRDDVNFGLLQYFINYNLDDGWYLTSAPINTANWQASSSEAFTVPIGGGFGKIFRIGKQPINSQLQAFYNVEHPDDAADWQLRFQFQFLFPKK